VSCRHLSIASSVLQRSRGITPRRTCMRLQTLPPSMKASTEPRHYTAENRDHSAARQGRRPRFNGAAALHRGELLHQSSLSASSTRLQRSRGITPRRTQAASTVLAANILLQRSRGITPRRTQSCSNGRLFRHGASTEPRHYTAENQMATGPVPASILWLQRSRGITPRRTLMAAVEG